MGIMTAIRREAAFFKGAFGALSAIKHLDVSLAQTVADDFEASVDKYANRPAFVFEGAEITYRDFDAQANRFAHWALAQGLKPGDAVALFMQNRPDYVACWVGLSKVGLVCALINSNLQGAALAHCIRIANAKAVIVGAELAAQWASAAPLIGGLPAFGQGRAAQGLTDISLPAMGLEDMDAALDAQSDVRPDRSHRAGLKGGDLCMFIYTSGTTGLPKAARMIHTRVQMMLNVFAGAMHSDAHDRVYVVLPLYHATGGLAGIGAALMRGGVVILRRKFSATHFWDDVVDCQATMFVYIGELCRYLINQPPHPKETSHRLQLAFGNGLRPEVWERFQPRFRIPKIFEFYGSTEGNVALMNYDGKLGAIGRIPRYFEKRMPVKILKFDVESEQPVRGADGFCIEADLGEPGEAIGPITNETRQRFEGYSGDEQNTQKKVLRDVFERGDMWFRTGDLLKRDAEGYFFFVDRIGDTFRWKGENVSTNEVAEVLSTAPGVLDANVYGVTVANLDGRAGMVAMVAGPDLDLPALHAHVARNLPPYARPMFLRMMPEVEVTGTFKYRKVDLVKQGFDPAVIPEPIYFDHPVQNAYVALTPEVFADIMAGRFKM
jgi:fatty-acyl-CoA synthase